MPVDNFNSPFVQRPDLHLLEHRPHKSALLLARALTATALFRIWPILLFMGAWAAAVVLINKETVVELSVPSTMLTVWGVLLGLTLTYRTNSAYERYWEGRKVWSSIILASRTWARIVWIHCPETYQADPIDDPEERDLDKAKALVEKRTMVQMALAFAVAVKHYLRGEEGIYYEDLYDLVRFLPSLNMPSGIVDPSHSTMDPGANSTRLYTNLSSSSGHSTSSKSGETEDPSAPLGHVSYNLRRRPSARPPLKPAEQPPVFRWSETFPIRFIVSRRQREKAEGRNAMRTRMKLQRVSGGAESNIPLEITLFMSTWVATLQQRKVVDVPTINSLLNAVYVFSDSLSSLERILTTPIPWSYVAHIWEITIVYCLLLPFQLYSVFGWVTIPVVMITAYIVIGFAEIGSEIENPFGYDPNDLNLDFFVESIIKPELAAVTARSFDSVEQWIFHPDNASYRGLRRESASRLPGSQTGTSGEATSSVKIGGIV